MCKMLNIENVSKKGKEELIKILINKEKQNSLAINDTKSCE